MISYEFINLYKIHDNQYKMELWAIITPSIFDYLKSVFKISGKPKVTKYKVYFVGDYDRWVEVSTQSFPDDDFMIMLNEIQSYVNKIGIKNITRLVAKP